MEDKNCDELFEYLRSHFIRPEGEASGYGKSG